MELKKEAIIKEIKICQELIDKFEKELEDVQQTLTQMLDRIAVLNALDNKLQGTLKMLNSEDLNNLTKEKKKLVPEMKRYQHQISNMQANIKALNELIDENF